MSIAEMFIDDPFGMADLHGLPPGMFMDGFSDFEDEMEARSLDKSEVTNTFKPASKSPTLIIDDGDTRCFATPDLTGSSAKNGHLDKTHTQANVQKFWKDQGGYVRVCLDAEYSEKLLPKLIKTRNFTTIILAGSLDGHAGPNHFERNVVPLLLDLVKAGGCFIVQDGQNWSDGIKDVFKDHIHWSQGGGARGWGVHNNNKEACEKLFPEVVKERQGRTDGQCFYCKGHSLENVPDNEAFFSSFRIEELSCRK